VENFVENEVENMESVDGITIKVNDVAEMLGQCCLACQKKMYQELTRYLDDQARNKTAPFKILEDELVILSKKFRTDLDAVKAGNRSPNVVHVRRLLARKAKELGFSYPQIGMFLGVHHTTVLNLVKKNGCYERNAAK
jgi:chromosomal replication initiation ATPase DnaA